jgi:hypothetical protein
MEVGTRRAIEGGQRFGVESWVLRGVQAGAEGLLGGRKPRNDVAGAGLGA